MNRKNHRKLDIEIFRYCGIALERMTYRHISNCSHKTPLTHTKFKFFELLKHIKMTTMKMKIKITILSFLLFHSMVSLAQSSKFGDSFADPIMIDSNSTIMIPTRYNSDLFASSKMTFWGDFYSNILFYDFTSDTYTKLFEKDTYIFGFQSYNYRNDQSNEIKNIGSEIILYRVKSMDYNGNSKIDNNDPAIVYVSDLKGKNLRALTNPSENAVEINLYKDQNFALIKMQRDVDGDKDFGIEDKSFYYVKLDLATLTFGNKIEVK